MTTNASDYGFQGVAIASLDKSISKDLYEALKENQWQMSEWASDEDDYDVCPQCFAYKPEGHTDTCIVGNAIKRYEATQ